MFGICDLSPSVDQQSWLPALLRARGLMRALANATRRQGAQILRKTKQEKKKEKKRKDETKQDNKRKANTTQETTRQDKPGAGAVGRAVTRPTHPEKKDVLVERSVPPIQHTAGTSPQREESRPIGDRPVASKRRYDAETM